VEDCIAFGQFHPPSSEYDRDYFKAVSGSLEGNFRHLYVDYRNLVTIGIGYVLDGVGGLPEAQTLPFFFSKDHRTPDIPPRRATPADIAADYAAVSKLNGRQVLATYQAKHTKLVTTQETIEQLYTVRVQNWERTLARYYGNKWRQFPSSAKLGLMSIAFGVGHPGTEFRNLSTLVKKFDFYGASKEAQYGIQGDPYDNLQVRGAWQKILFEYAALEYLPWTGPDRFPTRGSTGLHA